VENRDVQITSKCWSSTIKYQQYNTNLYNLFTGVEYLQY
jgi:hypothetical protein